ncbi:MAG: hypothetical protein ABL885_00760 [Methylophilaceae bacterium]
MARIPRFYLPDQPLHVIQRGNNRDPIFAAEADYHFYLRRLLEATATHALTIHAYTYKSCTSDLNPPVYVSAFFTDKNSGII